MVTPPPTPTPTPPPATVHVNVEQDRVSYTAEEVLFPSCLTPQQRRTVHVVAAELGLFHTSRDQPGGGRCITVSRSPLAQEEPSTSSSGSENIPKPDIHYAYFRLSEEERRHRLQVVEGHYQGWTDRLEQLQLQYAREPSLIVDTANSAEVRYEIAENHLIHMIRVFRASLRQSSSPLQEQVSLRHEPSIYDVDRVRFRWVDSVFALEEMAAHLRRCRVFSLDLEMHSVRSYYGHTCLLQISTSALYSPHMDGPSEEWSNYDSFDYDYVVDTIALWEQIGPELGDVLGDPDIVKLVHGAAGGDVPAFFRDFGLVLVSSFDTQEACSLLKRSCEENDEGRQRWWWGGKVGLGSVLTSLDACTFSDEKDSTQSQDNCQAKLDGPVKLFARFDEVKRRLATADWRER